MDPYREAISRIIKEQQAIIGPVALEQARQVSGLKVTSASEVSLEGDKRKILESLVNQFAKLFGRASIEVSKEAFEPFVDKIPEAEVPDVLKN